MTFVYPYIYGPSWWAKSGQFYELDWSIQTVRKFYPGAEVVVIGDDPKLDVEHIPAKQVQVNDLVDYRHADIMRKLEIATEHFDKFVWMYDDIYFLRKIRLSELKKTYVLCEIEDLSTYVRKGGMLYTRLWRNTYKKVAQITDKLYDYETHMPRYLVSERVKWLIKEYDLHKSNLLFTSLYPAIFAEKVVNLSKNDGIRSHVDVMGPNIDLDREFSRKFLIIDDNACTPEMTDRIKKLVKK
jgi:hypothetical protein